jgi:hypothetical protein
MAARPLRVRAADWPAFGFGTGVHRCWTATCTACGEPGRGGLLLSRSARLDRPGWDACITAARAHIREHTNGGRL